ncbi:putative nicotinate-nucleotide pyrophosphorylase [carboxylating] [bacterium BMS3Bbin06]|nr:putative nicotinate-nucleotide pyrophosphorylase [carboxylating] [bacterium BMS3Abin08]GBE33976.1 putative nicotinate-nucleotide pyrophosphorylase [carboxylating] [bacterium BMS3Bbin06]HDO36881.1 carboxylating nicotinate-nucleotide diphosphorylase [Nitrospirota bacterium]HDY71567.1 carboxylating nicotinate-nucleotide diphosphorylase [Nitrospirota bacterium]
MPLINIPLKDFLKRALEEDIGNGDITTELTVQEQHCSEAVILAKDDFIVAGLPFAKEIFSILVPGITFRQNVKEGQKVQSGDTLAWIKGLTRALLMGERTALNILQRLSGIATLTGRFVEEIADTGAILVDTRKTTPNMRYLEKYAVRVGGGMNHRFGLFDGILIKDNHIKASGGVTKAVESVKKGKHHLMKLEVEVKTLQELDEAITAGADIILLDNMKTETIREAVGIARKHNPPTHLEASGGITIENVSEVALTGVNLISSGAITHSATSVDISMKIL